MAKNTAFENWRISHYEGLVTLTLDRFILHTVVHQSLTSAYKPNFTEIKETFCGRTNVRTNEHWRPTLLGRLRRVDLIKCTDNGGGGLVWFWNTFNIDRLTHLTRHKIGHFRHMMLSTKLRLPVYRALMAMHIIHTNSCDKYLCKLSISFEN